MIELPKEGESATDYFQRVYPNGIHNSNPLIPVYVVINEDTPDCQWGLYVEATSECPNKGTKAIVKLPDAMLQIGDIDQDDEIGIHVGHLCDEHIKRAYTLTIGQEIKDAL